MTASATYLVTGATGVVGSALVPLLLADPQARARLLIRARSADELQARLAGLRRLWLGRPGGVDPGERVTALRADVTQPRLGLDDAAHAALAREVTHIVHAAGDVNLSRPLDAAREAAVTPMRNVLAFARACANVPKLDYVSTVGVAGRRPGVVPETALVGEAGYHNTYEQAKAEAEALLLAEPDVPFTIHRPSMVVGDSRDGAVASFQVFYHLVPFLAGSRTRGVMPRLGEATLDLVPVDRVARVIAWSSRREDSAGRILHLCSGPERAVPLRPLSAQLRAFLAAQGERTFRPREVPRASFRLALRAATLVAPPRARRGLQALPFFLDYLDEDQRFDDRMTDAWLRPHGLGAQPVADYLPAVLEYWRSHTLLREAA